MELANLAILDLIYPHAGVQSAVFCEQGSGCYSGWVDTTGDQRRQVAHSDEGLEDQTASLSGIWRSFHLS